MNSFSQPASSNLEPALIKLEAAQDVDDLWQALRFVLHSALPLEFCCLNFCPFLATPPMLFRERVPFSTLQHFQRFCGQAPFTRYLQANPGIQHVRLSDIINEAELLPSEYFHEFMQPTNSRYEAYLIFWHDALFEGVIGLHRTTSQGDFSDAEISLLLHLYPHCQNALRRVLQLHRERAMRTSVELLLDRLPLATIILDWDFKITYHNRAAEDLGVLWNLGPDAARSLKPTKTFAPPPDIIDACRRLKEAPGYHPARAHSLGNGDSLVIHHQKLQGLRAQVSLLQMDAAPLSPPMFIVRLESRERYLGKNNDDLFGGQLALWASLSRCEQRVAWLASQGHRNAEIARRLRKSSMTVKKQLQSVYRKLEVSGRSRLIALVSTGIDPS
jgi:DNA-binding CsgD family transcriptional regulator/PAS domain-containing protein